MLNGSIAEWLNLNGSIAEWLNGSMALMFYVLIEFCPLCNIPGIFTFSHS